MTYYPPIKKFSILTESETITSDRTMNQTISKEDLERILESAKAYGLVECQKPLAVAVGGSPSAIATDWQRGAESEHLHMKAENATLRDRVRELEGNREKLVEQVKTELIKAFNDEADKAKSGWVGMWGHNRVIAILYRNMGKREWLDDYGYGRMKANGNNGSCTKLTWEDVQFIRQNKGRLSSLELGAMFHIHRQSVNQICRFRSWKSTPAG